MSLFNLFSSFCRDPSLVSTLLVSFFVFEVDTSIVAIFFACCCTLLPLPFNLLLASGSLALALLFVVDFDLYFLIVLPFKVSFI